MPGALAEVQIEGLADLQRAFSRISKDLNKELKAEIRKAVEPLATRAESLAISEITNMTPTWAAVRIGVTRNLVYMVPKKRGTKQRGRGRPNLVNLLLDEAYDPAFEAERDNIVERLDEMLGRLGAKNGF